MHMTRQLGIVAGTVVECRETHERMQSAKERTATTPLVAALDSIDQRETGRLLVKLRGEAQVLISMSYELISESMVIERELSQ